MGNKQNLVKKHTSFINTVQISSKKEFKQELDIRCLHYIESRNILIGAQENNKHFKEHNALIVLHNADKVQMTGISDKQVIVRSKVSCSRFYLYSIGVVKQSDDFVILVSGDKLLDLFRLSHFSGIQNTSTA